MEDKNRIFFDDIGIIRGFCIICILIGHSFAIYTGSSYWTLPSNVDNISIYKWINPCLTSFPLQIFVFISGYLFSHQQWCKTYKTLNYTIKKAKRILLPCLLFGIVYYLLIDRYKFGNVSIEYFLSGPGHLWFLPMIFCCYVVAKILWKYIGKPRVITFITLFIIGCFSIYIPKLICIQNFATYFIFFIIGAWCYSYKDTVLSYLNNNKNGLIICAGTLILIIFNCYLYYNHVFNGSYVIRHGVKLLLGIIGGISCLYIANTEIINKNINVKFTRWNGWYGIYIYHQFILMIIYYNLPVYVINKYLLPFIALIIGGILSYILVKYTLKTKFGKWLIG